MSILDDINNELSRVEQTKEEIGDAINNLYDNSIVITEETPFSEYAEKIKSFPNGNIELDELYSMMYTQKYSISKFHYLFAYYQGTSLDLSNLNTFNITDMNSFFQECKELTELDLSNFDTSNVTNMYQMFYCCTSLTSLDLSSFDTSNVTNMGDMFCYCLSLTSLDLSSFDTSNVTNMDGMFDMTYIAPDTKRSDLVELNLSNFKIKDSTYVAGMFKSCLSLHTLRLDNCDNTTIKKIITSSSFPTERINGVERIIYCKEANASGLTAPSGWVFSYI